MGLRLGCFEREVKSTVTYVVAASFAVACSAAGGDPEVNSIDPPRVDVAMLPVQVTVRGAHFVSARVSLDDRAPAGVLSVQATVGGALLTSVVITTPDTLTGFVPASLPVGAHDVEVRLGDGRRGILPGGFVVVGGGVQPSVIDPNVCNAGDFGVPELVWPASTTNDHAPSLSHDRLTLVFSRPGPVGDDVFQATRPNLDSPFGEPVRFEEFTGGNNTTPALSADERTIYFASDRSGSWDIWSGNREPGAFTFGSVKAIEEVNSTAHELHPWVTADGLTMYFESDRAGGTAYDIWRATRTSVGALFSQPVLVAALNAPSNDGSPSLTPDGLTCFYTSDAAQVGGWKTLLRTQRAAVTDDFGWGVQVASLSGFNISHASLSGDGRELVFSAAGPTVQQLWRVPINCTR